MLIIGLENTSLKNFAVD